MLVSEHHEVIKGKGQLIATDIIESEEEYMYGSIDYSSATLD